MMIEATASRSPLPIQTAAPAVDPGYLRFFLTAYLGGFVLFLAILL